MLERPGMNIGAVIVYHAKFRGGRTAFICGERRVAWAEFAPRVCKVANALIAAGLQKGDKVSLLALNSIQALEIMYGTLLAGGVIVPISALLTPEMIGSLIADSASCFFFVGWPLQTLATPIMDKLPFIPKERRLGVGFASDAFTGFEDFIASASEADPGVNLEDSHECNIIYSSGTTGAPKGIVHTHLARGLSGFASAIEFRIDSSSTTIISTPLFANATWLILLATISAGGVTVLLPLFKPEEFLSVVQQEGGTHIFLVPTQYQAILNHPGFKRYDLSSLRIMVSMGAAMPVPLKRRILDEMGPGLMDLYGLTEGFGSTLKPEDIERKTGSVGTPVSGTDIRIIDDLGRELQRGEVGEIVGTSPGIMKGYHNRPEATDKIIWQDVHGRTYIRSGDVGRLDEDGFLYILDRKKDMIVSGGVNVFAIDIEEALIQHSAVKDVAVIAVPHEKWGEAPLALVILQAGANTTEEDLKEWVNTRVGKHQRVIKVEFCTEPFPRNVLGKVLKRQLREPYWRKSSSGGDV